MIPIELYDEVVDLLTLAEKLGLSFKTVDLEDQEVLDLYASVLYAAGITSDHVKRARIKLLSGEKDFPKPNTLLAYCERARAEMIREAEKAAGGWILAIDESGAEVCAPRNRVRNGRVLPPGDLSGDGSPAKALGNSKPVSRDWVARFWKEQSKKRTGADPKTLEGRFKRMIRGGGRVGSSDTGLPEARRIGRRDG